MTAGKTVISAICLIALICTLEVSAQPYATGAIREYVLPSWIKPSPPIPLIDEYDESCDLSPNFPPVGNQGGQGSCTAWATAYYYKSYQEWQERGWDLSDPNHQFSPAFVYNQINGGMDWGSGPSDAFLLLTELGCASMAQMPYTDQNCTNQPSEEAYYTAIPYRSQEAYYIDLYDDLSVLKNHLLNGNAAAFAFTVWDNFNNLSAYNNIYSVATAVWSPSPGGHCVTFCGFDDSLETPDGYGAFKVANSWGASWGDNGYFWITYEAVQNDTITWQWGYYTSDRIGYQPTTMAVIRLEHDDRYACQYQFGLGDYLAPLWSQNFFEWNDHAHAAWPFETSNIVIDLTDVAPLLDPLVQNEMYMRTIDCREGNSLDGSVVDFMVIEPTWPSSASSPDTPVPIPDDSTYAYATLQITQGTGTSVSGTVSGVWSPANNPYYASGDLTVPSGETLTIEPGTQVLFLEYGALNVSENAVLQAVGTEAEPILIQPLIYAVGWHGVRFVGASADSRLEHCQLRYGKAFGTGDDAYGGAVYCSGSQPTIVNCLIEECTATDGAGIYCLNSSPDITNNTITHNSAGRNGGGLYCQNSDPAVSGNDIIENDALIFGGAVYSMDSNPQITDNSFEGDESGTDGGAVFCSGANPLIQNNAFSGNHSSHGGAICSRTSYPTIEQNTFSVNTANEGGAVYCEGGDVTIRGNSFNENDAPGGGAIRFHQLSVALEENEFTGNSAGNGGALNAWFTEGTISANIMTGNDAYGLGGAVYLMNSDLELVNNLIAQNSANAGGGIYLLGSDPAIVNNTIADNTSTESGGALGSTNGSRPVVMNSILYGNNPDQVYEDSLLTCTVAYCDVEGGFAGEGNIDQDPLFVGPPDYHLSDGSPCISSAAMAVEIGGNLYMAPSTDIEGNPRPNPEGSIPDQGAYESPIGSPVGGLEVEIVLTPYGIPITVPATGGSFDYNVAITNNETGAAIFDVWNMVQLPDGSWHGPLLGPINLTLPGVTTINRDRIQTVPGASPMGTYTYAAYVGIYPAEIWDNDSFTFEKEATGDGETVNEWTNTGDSFEEWYTPVEELSILPVSYSLDQNYPNPFNAETVIPLELPQRSQIKIELYNIMGQKVDTIYEGVKDAGWTNVRYNTKTLPSGVYIYYVTAEGLERGGIFQNAGKMVLLK